MTYLYLYNLILHSKLKGKLITKFRYSWIAFRRITKPNWIYSSRIFNNIQRSRIMSKWENIKVRIRNRRYKNCQKISLKCDEMKRLQECGLRSTVPIKESQNYSRQEQFKIMITYRWCCQSVLNSKILLLHNVITVWSCYCHTDKIPQPHVDATVSLVRFFCSEFERISFPLI